MLFHKEDNFIKLIRSIKISPNYQHEKYACSISKGFFFLCFAFCLCKLQASALLLLFCVSLFFPSLDLYGEREKVWLNGLKNLIIKHKQHKEQTEREENVYTHDNCLIL